MRRGRTASTASLVAARRRTRHSSRPDAARARTTSAAPSPTASPTTAPTTTTTTADRPAHGPRPSPSPPTPICPSSRAPRPRRASWGRRPDRPTACSSTRSAPSARPCPSPSPQGVAYLSCAGTNFCAAAPNLNQVAFLGGSAWQAAGHHLGRAGHHGDRLHRAHLLHHDRRRGELVRLRREQRGPATSAPGGRPTRSRACPRHSASPPRAVPRCSTARPGPSRATSTPRASSTRSPAPRPRSASWSTATEPS